ncbi:hypothetical protein C9374_004525 [Naegleria lovaniensis]|uniref:non-specific serine/threonine protein kinase n=1 Tax=Naegleria lovaniensis TaxID=51637 RepID=A0AA88GS71_NAELO|nr:uncharacterized protein C9374_004525 [Naegleria lovaniensis]KAG2383188.1 hypothetical protein C9374_004525 [Naegleria lovaniensis]
MFGLRSLFSPLKGGSDEKTDEHEQPIVVDQNESVMIKHDTSHSTIPSALQTSTITTSDETSTIRRHSRRRSLLEFIGVKTSDDSHEHAEEKKPSITIPNNAIGVEFEIGKVSLRSDLSFTQYFSASIFDTILTISVKPKEEDELLEDDLSKLPSVQSSRIRKTPLSDGFIFDWKGEKVLLIIPLSQNELNQVQNICKSGLGNNSNFNSLEHAAMDSKKILPHVVIQLDNISRASEFVHNYLVKCNPHVSFLGDCKYDLNRLLDFRSKSVNAIELNLKRGKDKTGVISLSMKLVLPPEGNETGSLRKSSSASLSDHSFETISFDDSFITSGAAKAHPSEPVNIYDSNFDYKKTDTDNYYEDTHYELLECVGSGAFGRVYRARRKSNNTIVAIKKIACGNINNANDALVEFWPVRNIHHPYLVRIEDIYFSKQADDYTSLFDLCLVMEYLDCGDLEHFILEHKQQHQSIQQAHLLSLFIQMAAGLNHLHNNGLLHRDIKPKNILLENKGKKCKIGDYGLVYNLRSFSNLNETLSSAGTKKFQAPECHIGAKDICESPQSAKSLPQSNQQPSSPQTCNSLFMNYIYASDIWSLGIVFLETMSCDTLDVSPFISVMKNSSKFYEDIRTKCQNYHSGFAELIISMLSQNPRDRPDSEKVLNQLISIKKELYGQEKTVKIHPVIEIHRQLLSVGKSFKGLLEPILPIHDEELESTSSTKETTQGAPEQKGHQKSFSLLSSNGGSVSFRGLFSGLHNKNDDIDDDISEEKLPQDQSSSSTRLQHSHQSSKIKHDPKITESVFNFGLW